jgi:hypothetical protein
VLDEDAEMVGGEPVFGDAFGPLDGGDGIAAEEFIPAEEGFIIVGGEAVGVDVDEGGGVGGGVLVGEDEGGAGDLARVVVEGGGEGADEGGLARAEFAREEDEVAGLEDACEGAGERCRVVFAGEEP